MERIEEIKTKTYRYYYEDGLVEMVVGGAICPLRPGIVAA